MRGRPFAREGLALVRNRVFIELCEKQGDPATASLYRELIQPDEEHHHHLGQALLEELAIDEESQARATAAAMKTLEVASEMQEIAKLRFGITCAPGC